MKKIKLSEELTFVLATVILSFAVAILAAADFGVSMIVAPAYLLHLKLGFLSFGQCEYLIQALLFVAFCIIMKRVRWIYFASFAACLFYGFVLDAWRLAVPFLNPEITAPGSMSMPVRILFFIIGMLLTSLSIAMYCSVYLYPQVYDFFTKYVSQKFGIEFSKFKTCNDITFLLVSVAMTFLFFGSVKGIGIGTIVITLINGTLIGWFIKILDRYIEFMPTFKKFSKLFNMEESAK